MFIPLDFDKDCPDGYLYFEKSCYFASFLNGNLIEQRKKNWRDARDYCRNLSSKDNKYDLLSIQSENEFNWILTRKWSDVYNKGKDQFHIWIGLHRAIPDILTWTDGSTVKYGDPEKKDENGNSVKPWRDPEPNNWNGVSILSYFAFTSETILI